MIRYTDYIIKYPEVCVEHFQTDCAGCETLEAPLCRIHTVSYNNVLFVPQVIFSFIEYSEDLSCVLPLNLYVIVKKCTAETPAAVSMWLACG